MLNEILYCNLTVMHNKKEIVLKEVIYKENESKTYDKKKLFPEPVQVLRVEVIKRLGYAVKN